MSDVPVDPNSDEAILQEMDTGARSAKEAADIMVARMLQEESAAGRTDEPEIHRARTAGAQEQGAADAAGADKEEASPAQENAPPETDSQRRRRLRREASERVRIERDQLAIELGRTRERLRQIQEQAPDPGTYNGDQATYAADRAAAAAHYALTQQRAEELESRQSTIQQQEAAISQEAAREYLEEGRRRFPDFEAVIFNDNLRVTNAMTEALMAEGMQEVAYDLARNPREMNAIAALPTPIDQVMAIAERKAALKARAAAAKTSAAPPPIRPVKGGTGAVAKNPSEMTMAEYAAWRSAQSGR